MFVFDFVDVFVPHKLYLSHLFIAKVIFQRLAGDYNFLWYTFLVCYTIELFWVTYIIMV